MSPLHVAVAGVTGWLGRPLAKAVTEQPEMQLVAGVARGAAGKDLGRTVTGAASGVTVCETVKEVLAGGGIDVLVEISSPEAAFAHARDALGAGVSVVLGTSGLLSGDLARLGETALAHGVGIVAAGNFSVLAAALEHAALLAAPTATDWEVIDYASPGKPDAPSGTARQLAERLAEHEPRRPVAVADTLGAVAARGATLGGAQVHSLRLPGYVLSTEVILATDDERLVLRHDAGTSAAPYLPGALTAIRHVGSVKGLVRGMERLLFGARA